jgi:hypothetical protein
MNDSKSRLTIWQRSKGMIDPAASLKDDSGSQSVLKYFAALVKKKAVP